MREPLNDFLENIEAVVNNPVLTNESFGAFVRTQWAAMQAREQNAFALSQVVINRHGYPVQVAIPQEG